jgi:hypothetical protein
MANRAVLVGLANASYRSRVAYLKDALAVLRDPSVYTDDPITFGRAYQRIFDAFSIWGWAMTGADPSVAHQLGRKQKELLAQLYEEWEMRRVHN